MVENIRDAIKIYRYFDDGGFPHKVRLTTSVAAAGEFAEIPPDELDLQPKWKGGRRTMRHVTIRTADGRYHDTVPIASSQNDTFNNGGTIDGIGGRDGWVVTGKVGENKTFT